MPTIYSNLKEAEQKREQLIHIGSNCFEMERDITKH